jgi:integrase
MLVSEFFVSVYEPLRLISAAAHCRYQYGRNIALLSEVIGHPAALEDLSDVNLARVVSAVLKRGRSPATANKIFSQLRALWEFAAKRGLVQTYPTLRKIPEYRRVPVAWNRQQLAALFSAVRKTPGRICGVRAAEWWLGLHALLWDTGLRIGTALKLQWSDIDWHAGEIIARAEIQKQRADQRFKLHPDTLAILTLIRQNSRGEIFPWSLSRSSLWDAYDRILRRADLPHDRRSKFHRMRRSVASWFEEAGGDATSLLGHSSRKVTEAYLDESIVHRPNACDRLFRPLDPPHDRSRPPGG